ncbi:MAG: glycosyltransferase family 1 protein [archaeon]|nr:glycosyltransferase family 1 protein [archaeon]
MIAIANNFSPKTGIGKYSFNLFKKASKEIPLEMIYFESNDNKIGQMNGVKKITQGFNFPFFNKSISWYFYFPPKIPKGYELYHLSSQFLARSAKFVSPCIITHMDLAPLVLKKEYPFITRFLLSKVLPFYDKMEKIITISEKAKQELVDYGFADKEKVVSIPLGFDAHVFMPKDKIEARKKLGLPLEKKIVLNVGSEEPRKNIPCLLNVCKKLQNEFNDFMLVRIGNRNTHYDEMKKGLNILDANKVSEELLPFYYSAADVFVFPSTYEGGFAYPPLEAMACGLPTIVGQELEIFKNGARMTNALSEDEVFESAKKILSDQSEAKKWSKKALDDSKNFTLDLQVKKTLQVYKDVLGSVD